MPTVSTCGEYYQQGDDREENHAAATGEERRRSESLCPEECLVVEPHCQRSCEQDRDDITDKQHGEACGDARRVPPKGARPAVEKDSSPLER